DKETPVKGTLVKETAFTSPSETLKTECEITSREVNASWQFYGLSCMCVALWFLVLTPSMCSVLKKESTPANIWMILAASLFGTLLAYCVTSFEHGWGITLGRGVLLVVEYVILAFLSMLWMSFLEKRSH
ncbi:MAG: hypothetical protein Q4C70_10805, partial [Planctomycetia bacterium]|nr:hypothetical protein [Planctomycetia bacterium]